MRGRLQFVLILPDGSKSLVPAEWTDFTATTGPPPSLQLVGSLEDLLRLRSLVDALLRRSADVPVGLPQNLIQYAALALAIAHVTGTEAYEYVHSFSDAHIYVDQVDSVKTMLEREPRRLPTLTLNKAKTDLFDFRREDFTLTDYDPHPGIKKIPVAI